MQERTSGKEHFCAGFDMFSLPLYKAGWGYLIYDWNIYFWNNDGSK